MSQCAVADYNPKKCDFSLRLNCPKLMSCRSSGGRSFQTLGPAAVYSIRIVVLHTFVSYLTAAFSLPKRKSGNNCHLPSEIDTNKIHSEQHLKKKTENKLILVWRCMSSTLIHTNISVEIWKQWLCLIQQRDGALPADVSRWKCFHLARQEQFSVLQLVLLLFWKLLFDWLYTFFIYIIFF